MSWGQASTHNGEIVMKKMLKKTAVVVVALALIGTMTSFASTPQFGKTQEEWDKLQDNTLEYDEIQTLVHEYNTTVKNNEYALKKYKDEKGTTNAEARAAYEDSINALRDSMDYSDSSSAGYSGSAISAVLTEQSIASLESSIDAVNDDYETTRLGYEMSELALVQSTKSNMIAYYTNVLSAENAGLNAELAQAQLDIAKVQEKTGNATQLEVLTATEALLSAQQAEISAKSDVTTSKKKLQVACGWSYDSDPVLGSLPAPEYARAKALDPKADLETAMANNYTLKINKRKYDNSIGDTTRKTLKVSIDSASDNISASLNNLKMAVDAALRSYEYAQLNNKLQQTNLTQSKTKFDNGSMNKVEYRSAQITARSAQIALKQAEYKVLEALMNYDYGVAGLASN